MLSKISSPALQDAQAEGLSGQERGPGDKDDRGACGRVRPEFFHIGGHIEVWLHGRPIVKHIKLAVLLRDFGRL